MREHETEGQQAVRLAEGFLSYRSQVISQLPDPPAGLVRRYPYRVPPEGSNPAWGWIPVEDLSDHARDRLSHASAFLHRIACHLPLEDYLGGETLSVEALRQLHGDYSATVSDWSHDDVPPPFSPSELYCYLEGVTLPEVARSLDHHQLSAPERRANELVLGYKKRLLPTIGAAVELDQGTTRKLRENVRYYDQEAHDLDQRLEAAEFVRFVAQTVETPDRRGIRDLEAGEVTVQIAFWRARFGAAYDVEAVVFTQEQALGAARRKVLELELLQRRTGSDLAYSIGVYRTVFAGLAESLGLPDLSPT